MQSRNSHRGKTLAKSLIMPVARRFVPFRWAVELVNFHLKITNSDAQKMRRTLANRYLRGEGIEIGALHSPLRLPRGAHVRYLDHVTTAQARANYTELRFNRLVSVDIIDEGETLASIPLGSQDFIVANHMLEHCVATLQTLENWLARLKPGGVLYFALPDASNPFDRERAVTPVAHFLRDYREGADVTLREHYREWGRIHAKDADLTDYVESSLARGSNIHFHVFRLCVFLELMVSCRQELGWQFDIEAAVQNVDEFVMVLRKPHS